MKITVRTGIAAAAGIVGLSVVAFGTTAMAGDDEPVVKRLFPVEGVVRDGLLVGGSVPV